MLAASDFRQAAIERIFLKGPNVGAADLALAHRLGDQPAFAEAPSDAEHDSVDVASPRKTHRAKRRPEKDTLGRSNLGLL